MLIDKRGKKLCQISLNTFFLQNFNTFIFDEFHFKERKIFVFHY